MRSHFPGAQAVITTCIPLPGQGLVARSGDLIALADGLGPDADSLLTVLAEVAAADGDGGALVRGAARAALACHDQPSWACAGVTTDGELAVLVHGAAAAAISVDGGSTVTLTGRGALLPVSLLLAGGTVAATITLSGPAEPDARLRLDGGVVRGGGVAITVTAETAAPDATAASIGTPPAETADISRPLTMIAAPIGPLTMVEDPNSTLEDSLIRADEAVPAVSADVANLGNSAPVLVDGVLCAQQHFNDPTTRYCRQCGLSIAERQRNIQRLPRPPLGALLLDDGTGVVLDADYVLGREPLLDEDVAAGRARALRISDPDGTVSRLHLRVSLVGWHVEVSDLGSVNGSVLRPAEGPEAQLQPHHPVTIEPGTQVGIGSRSFQYLSHRGS